MDEYLIYGENNKLIAEFMGAELGNGTDDHPIVYINIPTYCGEQTLSASMLKYHKRWDWLMPVIEKIENDIGHAVVISQENVTIIEHDSKSNLNELIYVDEGSKLESVYKAVVDFIKWYNKSKK